MVSAVASAATAPGLAAAREATAGLLADTANFEKMINRSVGPEGIVMQSARGISVVAICLVLAACDQNSNDVTVKGGHGSVTISANGQHFAINANGDRNGSFAMSGSDGHFTMKASDGKQTVEINSTGGSTNFHVPDFVVNYPGARLQTTTIGTSVNGATGTFTFETADPPAAVISYYKRKSGTAGLSQAMNMNMGPATMFTANANGGKKVLQVIASASGNGAHVQVTWTDK